MQPVRLALVTETYPPDVNGVAMTLERLCRGLRERGHTVTIYRPVRRGTPEPTDPHLRHLPGLPIPRYKALTFGLPAQRSFKRAWRAEQPDLVHIATEGPLGWSAHRAARRLGIPATSSYHTNFHAYGAHYGAIWTRRLTLWWLRRLHNKTRATFAPSEDLIAQLREAGFRNLKLLSRGVDTTLFSPAKRDPALRATWGASEETPVAIYVGRLAPEKNLALTLRAAEVLRQEQPEAQVVLVGDGPARGELEQRFPWVHFAGLQLGEDLARHYASGDLFLFASETETFGNVLTEALASGLLVVAYNYAAAARYIRSGENGQTVPLGDAEAFVAATRELASQVSSWRPRRDAARVTAEAISWDRVIDGFARDLTEVLRTSH